MYLKLRKYLPENAIDGKAEICIDEGSTLEDLMIHLGIPLDKPGGAMINGSFLGIENSSPLSDGDKVSFFQPVAGG